MQVDPASIAGIPFALLLATPTPRAATKGPGGGFTDHGVVTPISGHRGTVATVDGRGVIWSATFPASGRVSFNPRTRESKDHGYLYQQNWAQYPRSMAADDAGLIYLGIGSTRGQIVALDRQSGAATPLVPEDQRVHGYSTVGRDWDGKVYAVPIPGKSDHWLRLHKGRATAIGQRGKPQPRHYISGSQGLFHNTFPDGKRLTTFSLVDRRLAVGDPKTRQTRSFIFAQSPVAIGGGGDYLDGRIYFFRGSHLYSYSLKAAR